ncbi:SusC/RagA family TonB-linked outer membrane protein [Chitinophaga niabensis]|uniref:TonB-linked outer membrane protein, SusC/RagA family n=1 Tax=Chitinophaga niabensis TaxID=536979 RepID=A0A1N6G6R3_9BACT|nr:SusC/RagA family TonB-linked outer membrane protein [Chitinophaga niabensis]SIO03239.1 TonB-linked outer membrane protein, SusC/RagA family [Chitinophaga niabensis]
MQLFRNCLRSYLLCLMMLCSGIAHAGPAWQKDAVITLQAREITLGKIFKAILQQTGIKIMYAGKMVNEQEVYTGVRFKATKLEDALQFLFKGKGLEWIYRDEVIILRPKATAVPSSDSIPVLNISGRVLDETGIPLPGATVLVKGMGKGTAADALGNFRVQGVPSNATLAVSFTGFEQQEISLEGRSELALALKRQVKEINKVEVFSTGYQDVPKERATGSFEFVNNEELNRRVGSDILSRLEGVTTSVFFDRRGMPPSQNGIAVNNLIIRGLSTLSADLKAPLVVVDNFPYDGNIKNINPNDVENITILKDAAAASIWGARAANGVIVITTKKGQFNQPVKLSFNSNISITEKPDLFHLPKMSSSEVIDVETFLFGQGYYNSIINNSQYPYMTAATEILLKRRSGLISAADSASLLDALRQRDVRHDFDRYIYRTAVSQQYALNLSGGSDKMKYLLSAGYDKTPSILKGDDYNRITVNTDNSFTPIKKLTIQFGVRYTNATARDNSPGDYGSPAFTIGGKALPSYSKLADEDGRFLSIPYKYREGYTDTAGAGRLLDWKYRPLEELDNADFTTKEREFVLSTGLNYKLTNYISLQASYQYQFANVVRSNHYNARSWYARDLINLYTNFNSTVPALRNPIPLGGILDEAIDGRLAHMGRGQVNFNHSWQQKHQLIGLIGGEIRERIVTTTTKRSYGYDENRLSTSLVDYINTFPQYGNRGPAFIPAGSNDYAKTTDHFVSFFGNAAYTYDSRYTISMSGRRDAANQFGVDVNDQWKPFWSAGGSWNISNEPFFKVKAISYLKLRVTYGYQGNVNNTLSPNTIISYANGNSTSNNIPFANIATPANPGLSWETVKQLNAGIDFRIIGNVLSGSMDVYQKKADNLILAVPMDLTTGVNNIMKNSAGMKGSGLDVLISSINFRRAFQWKTDLAFSYVSNKVTDLVSNGSLPRASDVVINAGTSIRPRIDRTPYALFSYPFAGLDPLTGNPQGYSGKKLSTNYVELGNQRSDTANLVYHGTAIPTIFGNLNNTFSYKGISLTINASYRFNYYFRKNTISYNALFANGATHPDFSKRWKQPGDEKVTNVPSMIYPISNALRDNFYGNSSVNILRGDNIRLNYIRLGYDISQELTRKIRIKYMQLYASIDNLGILWRKNKEGLDPDYDAGNTAYMPPKKMVFGLRMDF